jgi:hypothetical protein
MGDVAHRLTETEVVAFVLLDLALIVALGRIVGACRVRPPAGPGRDCAHNCRGLKILIVGLIGLQVGVLTEQMMAVFVFGAIVTKLMTGPLFDRFAPALR